MRPVLSALLIIGITLITAGQTFATEQTVCTVMEGNPSTRAFLSNTSGSENTSAVPPAMPDSWTRMENGTIPQFLESTVHQHEHQNGHFSTAFLIVPLGISTFVLMVATFLAGVLMQKNRKILFRWHRRLAVLTLLTAISHVLCVILAH